MREQYDTSGPGQYAGEPPMARYIMENYGPQDCDEDASHDGWGWVGRIGKRIITEDYYGFVYLHKCDNERDAKLKFASATEGWYDDDSEEEDY